MPRPTHIVAVRHPITETFVALDAKVDYDDDDPLVEAYPWAFVPIEKPNDIVTEVTIDKPARKKAGRSK